MCFFVTLTVSGDHKALEGVRVAPLLLDGVVVSIPKRMGFLRTKGWMLFLSQDGTCGCSMLGDDDGLAPEWRERLALAIETLASRFHPNDVSFHAGWDGTKREEGITLAALLPLIREGRYDERTSYRVQRAGDSSAR